MNRVPYGMAASLGLMLVLSTVIPAQSRMVGVGVGAKRRNHHSRPSPSRVKQEMGT
jgi:hypothetical protein